MTARCLMVLGTTSGAGKSWLTTALCRWYARQGLKVAPFKAQNMSNNARVVGTAQGAGEIGSAQYFQALAAGVLPDVRMNPVLLKPEAQSKSQVVLLGEVSSALTQMPWGDRSEKLWPFITEALDALRAENDLVIIEGAGSPAEINLMSRDIVNLRVARYAQARCLLITDIDRGGAFAHLYGTWALLPKADQALLRGFVLNKFRGEESLLSPAPEHLLALTGVPTVATVPYWHDHGLPEEDGLFDDRAQAARPATVTVAVIAYPSLSNLDEFQALKNIADVRLVWVRELSQLPTLKPTDWLVLPGSKHTSSDLSWVEAQGFAHALHAHAQQGGPILGICGGLQMLGQRLVDPHGVDGEAEGLGLLSVVTAFAEAKTVRRCQVQFGAVTGAWSKLARLGFQGYEIHQGQTHLINAKQEAHESVQGAPDTPDNHAHTREVINGLAWQNASGNVLGLYVHGLFEAPSVLCALFGSQARTLDTVFDGLADCLERNSTPGFLQALIAD